jgi:Tfp pilus assembly major pilin PilA
MMKKVAVLSSAILLIAGVAVAGEMTQSEQKVKEKSSYSTTVQEDANQAKEKEHKSTTVEKQRQTTTSDDMTGDTTTRQVEVEKKRSQTTTSEDTDSVAPGATQEYRHQSETHHQHTTKEVEKK